MNALTLRVLAYAMKSLVTFSLRIFSLNSDSPARKTWHSLEEVDVCELVYFKGCKGLKQSLRKQSSATLLNSRLFRATCCQKDVRSKTTVSKASIDLCSAF